MCCVRVNNPLDYVQNKANINVKYNTPKKLHNLHIFVVPQEIRCYTDLSIKFAHKY